MTAVGRQDTPEIGKIDSNCKGEKIAKITDFKGYEGEPPIPKPDGVVKPNIVTAHNREARHDMREKMMKTPSLMILTRFVVFSILAVPVLATTEYNEAPGLTKLVDQGKLPPIEERLPEHPLVLKPLEKIGTYGGTLHTILYNQPSDGVALLINQPSLTYLDTEDMLTVTPGLVESWEYSEDYKTLTLHFREGVKWSDGVRFTVDDVLFWYVDVMMNKDATPATPLFWKGSQAKKIDDDTIEFTFPVPKPHFFRPYGIRNNNLQLGFFLPKHYAKQFHIKYNPKAQQLAKANGFDKWYQLLQAKASCSEHVQNNPDVPVLSPWKVVKATPNFIMWERNPYFWIVDTEGNQLPYIDRLMGVFALNPELRQAKVLGGEVDLASPGQDTSLAIFPELKRKEKELGLRVWTTPSFWGNMFALMPNQTHKDPERRALFRNIKFRRALSLAIDRDELNEVLYLGLAIPQQTVPVRRSGFYWSDQANYLIEHTPGQANRLLDEVGLTRRNKQGFRTWPDGRGLKLKLDLGTTLTAATDYSELVARHLRQVGLDVSVNLTSLAALRENLAKKVTDIVCTGHGGGVAIDMFNGIHNLTLGRMYADAWHRWRVTSGQDGEEPADWLKEVIALNEKLKQVPEAESRPLIREAFGIITKQSVIIGTLAEAPVVHVVRDNLRNVDGTIPWDMSDWAGPLVVKPFQWYLE